jgi:protein disulfide isomerase
VENFQFGHRFDSKESIIVVTKDRETKTFAGEITEENVKSFIEAEGYPLVVELDQKTWLRSVQSKMTLLTVFYDPEQSFDTIKSFLKEISLEYKGKAIVTHMDGVTNEQLITRWGGSGKILPTAFVVSFKAEHPKVIAWNEETESTITKESLLNFYNAALDGTYTPYKKSEDIPTTNDEPVKKVVAKNFDAIVNDPTKDVLLEIYAPWCGHCKNLEPIYNEVAKKFADTPSVTIAKLDGTANALPEDIQIKGYPTILYFPANDKKNPISFEGNRELADIIQFIVEKSTHKIQFKEDL